MDKTLVNTRITLDTLHTIRGRKGIQNCIVKEEFLHDLPLWMHESLLNRHITQAELNDATTIYKVRLSFSPLLIKQKFEHLVQGILKHP